LGLNSFFSLKTNKINIQNSRFTGSGLCGGGSFCSAGSVFDFVFAVSDSVFAVSDFVFAVSGSGVCVSGVGFCDHLRRCKMRRHREPQITPRVYRLAHP
jgi:hypothetical protein